MCRFTEIEIELARSMKQHGLKWIPEIGDWFADGADTPRLVVYAIYKEDLKYHDDTPPYPIWTERGGNNAFGYAHEYIWLPSLEQSVAIVQQLLSACDYVEVRTTWWNDVCNAYIMYENETDVIEEEYAGDTQREALYKLLTDVLINTERGNDND